MPLTIPPIDARTYDQLREEALRRIPVHNPAWTNFNASDPGVTLIELFAFMTETLLYRANQIPERNRVAFLRLLGVPLLPAASARGIVTIANERGPLETLTLDRDVEVRAGETPFRTDQGLDVLPIEARAYAKQRIDARPEVTEHYRQLYASFAAAGGPAPDVTLYQPIVLSPDAAPIDLVRDTVDASLWVALLVRPVDKPAAGESMRSRVTAARKAIGGKVLSLGFVPVVDIAGAETGPTLGDARATNHLEFSVPDAGTGLLPAKTTDRRPSYRVLDPVADRNVLLEPGVVQVTLPAAGAMGLWTNLEPLEAGAGDFPPSLGDTAVDERLITWIRVRATSAQPATFEWCGINAVRVTQRVRVVDEALPDGTGDPDQHVRLAGRPVIPASVRLSVATDGPPVAWTEVDDLAAAGPEVTFHDPTLPPGGRPARRRPADVFVVDAEAGEIAFGDGERGRRPPLGATLRASYDISNGAAGNVGPGAIATGPTLPPGVKVLNPVRTWGGVDAETVASGEKRVAGFLRHGDRLVTADDHRALAMATPEVEVGRIDVLPAFDPRLGASDPGDAPGAVTLLAVPRYDLRNPDTPEPDGYFLDAVCRFLDPRRLVTTQLFLRGPAYVPLFVSVGIDVVPDRSVAETREAVKRALTAFLGPLPRDPAADVPPYLHQATGWPLRTEVRRLELLTYVARVDGVRQVRGLLLAGPDGSPVEGVPMHALELPRLAALSVTIGDALGLDQLKGTPSAVAPDLLPVPAPAEAC